MTARDSDEDLRALVAELEATLSALRAELEAADTSSEPRSKRVERTAAEVDNEPDADRRSRRTGSRRRSRPPRPPSLSELLRFTEQYTLPTFIATLEATIQSLELLRGALRLADPERSAFDGSERTSRSSASRLTDGVAGVGRGAVSGVERALTELQTALSESDLPEETDARTLLEDARRLSEDVSERLEEASGDRDAERYGYRGVDRGASRERDGRQSDVSAPSSGVEISVRDAQETEGDDAETEPEDARGDDKDARADDETPRVDVEAELASIRDEVDERPESPTAGDSPNEPDSDEDALHGDDDRDDTGRDNDERDDADSPS